MTRTLKINFSDEALNKLAKLKKRIVLVKESNEPCPVTGASIAWFTTTPFQTVKITWEDVFYMYGSQTEFKSNAIIDKSSYTPNAIVDGSFCYNFGEGAANFKSVDYAGQKGNFYMKNMYKDGDFTVFGLAQKISTGSKTVANPINAVEAALNDSIMFTPVEKIRVFMQADVQDSKVLTSISSEPILLDFTGKTAQEIVYNDESNKFFLK